MSAAGDARRARLGEKACRRAQELADAAPPFTPALRDVLATLLRRPRKTRRDDSRDVA